MPATARMSTWIVQLISLYATYALSNVTCIGILVCRKSEVFAGVILETNKAEETVETNEEEQEETKHSRQDWSK